jgi:hypothetical protein
VDLITMRIIIKIVKIFCLVILPIFIICIVLFFTFTHGRPPWADEDDVRHDLVGMYLIQRNYIEAEGEICGSNKLIELNYGKISQYYTFELHKPNNIPDKQYKFTIVAEPIEKKKTRLRTFSIREDGIVRVFIKDEKGGRWEIYNYKEWHWPKGLE